MCVKLTKVVRFTMAAGRANMRYSTRKAVEIVLNEGSDENFFFLPRILLILARSLCQ